MRTFHQTITIFLLSFFLLFCPLFSLGARATGEEVRDVQEGILAFKLQESGATTVEDWIKGELSEEAGIGAEWYVSALSQSGADCDFSAYEASLLQYLSQNTVTAAATRQKYAFALAAIGSGNAYISQTLSNSIGKQGVMSLVFGLHLLSNGYAAPSQTEETVVAQLLSLQREDGGWGVRAGASDVDVTAFVLQALASYRETDGVEAAITRALSLLSLRQTETGAFKSYGVENAESVAQVLTALVLLEVDFRADERFIKNGNSVWDALVTYRLSNGSFCHVAGEGYSASATEQVFFSLSAVLRAEAGKPSVFLLDRADPSLQEPTSPSQEGLANGEEPSKNDTNTPSARVDVRLWITVGILSLGGILCAVLLLLKKKHLSYYLATVAAVGLLIGGAWCLDIRSAGEYYSGEEIRKDAAVGSVVFSVRCDTVAQETDGRYIPKDGMILNAVSIPLAEGETPLDLLRQTAQSYGFHIDVSGGYVKGICHLYEFDFGDLSGWTYTVNGDSPSVGCGEYRLRDGDVVEFVYTRTLGKNFE